MDGVLEKMHEVILFKKTIIVSNISLGSTPAAILFFSLISGQDPIFSLGGAIHGFRQECLQFTTPVNN